MSDIRVMALAGEDVLAQGTRRVVFDYVRLVPGAHLRRIARELSLPIGQVMYHLDYLERREFVVAKRDQGFKRFFVRNLYSPREKVVLSACRHAVPRHVLVALAQERELSHRDILERVNVSASTLSFHLARMVDAGVLERERRGRSMCYRVADPGTVSEVLVKFRETFGDPRVDRFTQARAPALGETATRPSGGAASSSS